MLVLAAAVVEAIVSVGSVVVEEGIMVVGVDEEVFCRLEEGDVVG